ncbi:MAG: methylenetetrahydrofolate--tRNA-(uracil(54)-C(5))-methyltransferase (FADH(2)-oxidizing) TrmFO [Synergistaceae bacterium]|jgi:methylenetetrahydrofolate--tRNA-(uracil-5-)-methyltransferase|nr:methylenetetrahydrofolate--tRNA-(uracil(54)-C(5))-methyltransferase (FADH(2)-oxidizing) TrmFO [Synergistaceae bacterium]
MKSHPVVIVGGGLAGSEAAWQLASRGVKVRLFEMRPAKGTPAHSTGDMAELVCSNSLGADSTSSPAGILKQELRMLGSLVIRCADGSRVPAGKALAVDRRIFSSLVSAEIEGNRNIEVVRAEVTEVPPLPAIIAAGPLMSGKIAAELREMVGIDYLSFFDAVAPTVLTESIDMSKAYAADRYGNGLGGGDYINCPMDRERYDAFCDALATAERALSHGFDARPRYFEGCLPIEVMAERGRDTMRFGPLRPVGLPDPATGREPYAVVQLRRDDAEGALYNLVGFQTNLKWPEQDRVFRLIPALAGAEFARRGVMHRNSFVCAPAALDGFLRPARNRMALRRDLFLAGQITGVEGYVESAAMGAVAAIYMSAVLKGMEMPSFPASTAIGSLLRYLRDAEPSTFQPMNVNLGIFPKMELPKGRKLAKPERSRMYAERALLDMENFLSRFE